MGRQRKITARAGAVEPEYYHDQWSAIVSVPVILGRDRVGDVWVRAGVPDYLEGTARAAGSTRGLEGVQPYGGGRDMWCPPDLMDRDPDEIMDAVRDAALAAWRKQAEREERKRTHAGREEDK